MRWYIAEVTPLRAIRTRRWFYVAWATVFAGLLFVRKSTLTFALATYSGDHLVRVRLELDGPADQSVGSGLEIPMVDVPCGGYRGVLRFLRH